MAWAVRRLWQGDWHVARSFDLDTKKSLNIWNIMGFSLKHLEVLTSCSFIVKYFVAIKMLRFWNRSQGCWERDPLLTSSFNFLKKNLLHLSICPWKIPGCGLKLFGKIQSSWGFFRAVSKKKASPGGPWALFCTSSSTVSFPTCLVVKQLQHPWKMRSKGTIHPCVFKNRWRRMRWA